MKWLLPILPSLAITWYLQPSCESCVKSDAEDVSTRWWWWLVVSRFAIELEFDPPQLVVTQVINQLSSWGHDLHPIPSLPTGGHASGCRARAFGDHSRRSMATTSTTVMSMVFPNFFPAGNDFSVLVNPWGKMKNLTRCSFWRRNSLLSAEPQWVRPI